MRPITIHSEPYYRTYLTKKCTIGFLISNALFILAIFLPFITTYAAGEFWPRRATAFTAPQVKFKNKVYVEALLKDAYGVIDNQAFAASTLKPVHEASQYQLSPLIVESYGRKDKTGLFTDEQDFIEQWNLTVTLRLPEGKILHQVDLLAAFDYVTEGDVRLKMEALTHLSVQNNLDNHIRSVKATGMLELKQTSAMTTGYQKQLTDQAEGTILQTNAMFDSLETMSLQGLLREYSRRNETSKYVLVGKPQKQYGPSNDVQITTIIKIPRKQPILYQPQLFQVFKFAWIQYLAAFAFWYFLLWKGFMGYLVQNGVFSTLERVDLNVKNLSLIQ